MADDNPFQAFDTPDDARTEEHQRLLTQTRPWLLLIGVLTALVAGLGGLATAVTVLGGLAGLATGSSENLLLLGLAIPYLAIVLLYGAFAWLLIQQSTAITALANGGGLPALANVLRAHRNFWRLMGITSLVFMVLYCGGFIAVMAIGSSLNNTFGP